MIQTAILASDLHNRDQPYKDDLELSVRLIRDLGVLAEKNSASHLIIPGDFFHDKKPSYNLAVTMYEELEALRKKGLSVIWLRGNHDLALKSDPHRGLMTMYSRVCRTVMKPYIIENEMQFLAFLPWYPGPQFKAILKEIHRRALESSSKIKIIFGHVGVKEGEVSENYRVNQEVGSKDFCEDIYDMILLGDYHTHQYVTEKILYLGACVARDYGHQAKEYGPWLLNLIPSARLSRLYLPSRYPDYKIYKLNEAKIIPGYDPYNKNRIVCPVKVAPQISTMYPEAELVYSGDEHTEEYGDRLDGIDEEDWPKVWAEFSQIYNLDSAVTKLGRKYLERATP